MFGISKAAARRYKVRRIIKTMKNFVGDCVRKLKGTSFPLISDRT